MWAIAKTAERAYRQLSSDHQEMARKLLLRMILLGDGTADTRRRLDRANLAEHPEQARAALFDPAGRFLITSGLDGAIRLWPRSGLAPGARPVHTVQGPRGTAGLLAIDSASTVLATSAWQATNIRLWETDMTQAAAQICLLAAPVITRAQWTEHLPGYPYRPPCEKRQATTPAPATAGPASSGMKAVHSGKCVAARTNAVDAPLQQFRCKGLPASRWTFAKTGTAYRIGNAANGLCLDTRSVEQETIVVQRICSDSASQLWEAEGACHEG